MGLEDDILKLLKAEGYRLNETIKDALDEFIDTISDENEEMEAELEDDAVTGDVEDD